MTKNISELWAYGNANESDNHVTDWKRLELVKDWEQLTAEQKTWMKESAELKNYKVAQKDAGDFSTQMSNLEREYLMNSLDALAVRLIALADLSDALEWMEEKTKTK